MSLICRLLRLRGPGQRSGRTRCPRGQHRPEDDVVLADVALLHPDTAQLDDPPACLLDVVDAQVKVDPGARGQGNRSSPHRNERSDARRPSSTSAPSTEPLSLAILDDLADDVMAGKPGHAFAGVRGRGHLMSPRIGVR